MADRFREGRDAVRARIGALAERIEAMYRACTEGFDWSDLGRVRRARGQGEGAASEAEAIIAAAAGLSGGCAPGERGSIEPLIGAAGRLALIAGCIEEFCDSAERKIGEGLLFSDTACKEMEDLHAEVGELLSRSALSFHTGDRKIARRIAERGRSVERMIARIGAGHEERLASGACAARSSALFLELLDALRRIASHAVSLACASARGACDA